MITVLVADDFDIVRDGVKQILSATNDIVVEGEAATGAEAVEAVRRRKWDVVILDSHLPDRSGVDVLSQIRAIPSQVPVLILTAPEHAAHAARALKAGASGYVTKDNARQHLVPAIRKLARGQRFLTPEFAENLAFGMVPESEIHAELSGRELQILRLIALGRPPREIAAQLNISVKTVATHRARVLGKMGLKSNAELVRYAMEHSLIPRRR